MSEPSRAAPLRLVDDEGGRELRDVERARAGDVRAWSRLYQAHFRKLLRHAAFMCGDVGVAEDLVQEAFALALAKLESYDGRAPFEAWMRGVVTNLVRKHWRKRARRDRAHGRLETLRAQIDSIKAEDPERALTRERRAELLRAALEILPANLREAFVLADVQGLGAEAGGAALGISPGNFRVRASRARSKLRDRFRELGVLEEVGK